MTQFISRMFTPSKSKPSQPSRPSAPKPTLAPAAPTARAKKKTQTRYSGNRQADEADTVKKTLLGG